MAAAKKICQRGRRAWIEAMEPRLLLSVVPAGFTETQVVSGLTSPIDLAVAPDGRVFFCTQGGVIHVIKNDVMLSTPFVDMSGPVDGSLERGMQGIELDPNFATNGFIYIFYTAEAPQKHNRVSRIQADPANPDRMLAGSEVVLLDLPNLSTVNNAGYHMGGMLRFAADGKLIVGVGDHFISSTAQDINSPFGKMLRINPFPTNPPTDNPFYNVADGITWRDYQYAVGVRNPFSGAVQPGTGRIFINDVGQNTWEEINQGASGANFGWPQTEGNFNAATYPFFTQPFHSYQHLNGRCAITGGAFYNPTQVQFGPQYLGKYFYVDFCSGEMWSLDLTTKVATTFATGMSFPENVRISDDGTMWYIARGAGANGQPGTGTGKVFKIRNTVAVAPSIVQQPQSAVVSIGYSAQFSVSASGTSPLSYQWQRNGANIVGATAAVYELQNAQLADSGAQFRCVVTNTVGSATSTIATLTVTDRLPPVPTITNPIAGSVYRAGDTIQFSGGAIDNEDGPLSPGALTWHVDLHHHTHSHPFIPATVGIASGSFVIPTIGETDPDVWYRIHLTARDSDGMLTTVYRDIHPVLSNVTIRTNVPGLVVELDGIPKPSPHSVEGVVGLSRTLSVPETQTIGSTIYRFRNWSTSSPRVHGISFPETDTIYTANYEAIAFSHVSGLPFAVSPINAWGPVEIDMSNGESGSGDGQPLKINNVRYLRGLGTHANSEVRYNLQGGFDRFVTDVGVDDEVGGFGSVVFQVWADGTKIYDSGTMTGAMDRKTVDVSVAGVNQLRLVATDAGNGISYDHADWGDPRLLRVGGTYAPIRVNFQPGAAPVPAEYLVDAGAVYGSRGNGQTYGWNANHADAVFDRNVNADQRLDTLASFKSNAKWEIALSNGDYAVTIDVGDPSNATSQTLNVEGTNFFSSAALAGNNFLQRTMLIRVTDGKLTLDNGSSANLATRINYLEISALSAAVGASAPLITVDPLMTNVTSPALRGTVSEPDASIAVTVNAVLYAATNVGDGTWVLPAGTLPPLGDGQYSVTAVANSLIGQPGTDPTMNELIIDTTAPVLTLPPDQVVEIDSSLVTGAAVSFPPATAFDQFTANPLIWYSITSGSFFALGVTTVSVTATDLVGNATTGTFLVTVQDTIAPGSPTLSLDAGSDTGISTSDGITHDNTPAFSGSAEPGSVVQLLVNAVPVASTTATAGLFFFTLPAMPDGVYLISSRATDLAGNTSPASTAFPIIIDTAAPTASITPFDVDVAPHRMSVQFSEDVGATLSPGTFVATNLSISATIATAFTYSAANFVAAVAFTGFPLGILSDANYRLELSGAGLTDVAGNPIETVVPSEFFVLAADANRDRAVNGLDFNILSANFGQSPRTFSQGDFNYDGVVNGLDFNILSSRFGQSLPPGAGGLEGRPGTPPAAPSLPPTGGGIAGGGDSRGGIMRWGAGGGSGSTGGSGSLIGTRVPTSPFGDDPIGLPTDGGGVGVL